MASVLATFAPFERRLIGQCTRDALAVHRRDRPHAQQRRVAPRAARWHSHGVKRALSWSRV